MSVKYDFYEIEYTTKTYVHVEQFTPGIHFTLIKTSLLAAMASFFSTSLVSGEEFNLEIL